MKIRDAVLEDILAIQAVARESWRTTYNEIIPDEVQATFMSRAYSEQSMVNRVTRTMLLVAELDGEIVGFANFTNMRDNGEVELIAIYQLQRYQRQGIGTAMLLEGLSRLKEAKLIYLDVNAYNELGKSFYLKHGFIAEKQYEDELFGYKESLIRMTKQL